MWYSFKRVEEVFMRAIEFYSPGEREEFVRRECGLDSDTCERVLKLIRRHDESQGLLDHGVAGDSVEERNRDPDEAVGTYIGPYKLLQAIGEGGMGTVYMAEQKDPVERRVAIKVIKPGMDSRQIVARFDAERQALAMMNHPNIASVLDAGTTDQGRPYFVMELVKGIRINDYCDQYRLTTRQRLELFIPVCNAVQHAHQKGIIHRDLKPSNILIAQYDSQPVPKVIDFGVAKAIDQKLTELTLFTQIGQVIGTLDYMSPEQAQFNQADIDTRSDIYSLGTVLYEVLTGTTPFTRRRLKDVALDEVLRIIRTEDPPTPSRRLSTTENIAAIAIERQTEPARLKSLVQGELDWIVMTSLEKDRDRRYQTASGLGLDIRRYLDLEPVSACPPTPAYRLKKFALKNRGWLSAATSIASITLLAALFSTWQAFRAADQRDVAIAARNETKQALKDVTEEKQRGDQLLDQAFEIVDEFLVDISLSDDALKRSHGTSETRKRFLQRSKDYYQKFLTTNNQSKNQTLMVRACIGMAEVSIQLRELDEAQYQAAVGLDLAQELLEKNVDVSKNRLYAARLHYSIALSRFLQHDFENATIELERAIQLSETTLKAESDNQLAINSLAGSRDLLATIARLQNRLDEAIEHYLTAEEMFNRLLISDEQNQIARLNLATVRLNLADCRKHSETDQARACYKSALDLLWPGVAVEELSADELKQAILKHPALWSGPMIRVLTLHAQILNQQGKTQQALAAFDVATGFIRDLKLHDPDQFEFRLCEAKILTQTGNIRASMLNRAAAIADFEESNRVFEGLTVDYPDNIQLQLDYARLLERSPFIYFTFGQQQLAIQRLGKALEFRRTFVERFPEVVEYKTALSLTLIQMGIFLVEIGNSTDALSHYLEAESLIQAAMEAGYDQNRGQLKLGKVYNGLSACYEKLNDMPQAITCAGKYLDIYRQQFAAQPNNPQAVAGYRTALSAMGLSYNSNQQYIEAEECFKQSIELLNQRLKDIPQYLFVLGGEHVNLANSLSGQKKYPQSLEQYENALVSLDSAAERFPDHVSVKTFAWNARMNRATTLIDFAKSGQHQRFNGESATAPDSAVQWQAIVDDVMSVCESSAWKNDRYIEVFVEVLRHAGLTESKLKAITEKIPTEKRGSIVKSKSKTKK